MIPINYLAVLGATVAVFFFGWAWHAVFGKTWSRLCGMSDRDVAEAKAKGMKGMWKSMVLTFVGSLIMSYVLAHSLIFASAYLNASGISAGLQAGFWSWLGFIVPVTMGQVLWEKKTWKFWGFNMAYQLCSLLLMGVVLALWQ